MLKPGQIGDVVTFDHAFVDRVLRRFLENSDGAHVDGLFVIGEGSQAHVVDMAKRDIVESADDVGVSLSISREDLERVMAGKAIAETAEACGLVVENPALFVCLSTALRRSISDAPATQTKPTQTADVDSPQKTLRELLLVLHRLKPKRKAQKKPAPKSLAGVKRANVPKAVKDGVDRSPAKKAADGRKAATDPVDFALTNFALWFDRFAEPVIAALDDNPELSRFEKPANRAAAKRARRSAAARKAMALGRDRT